MKYNEIFDLEMIVKNKEDKEKVQVILDNNNLRYFCHQLVIEQNSFLFEVFNVNFRKVEIIRKLINDERIKIY